ncbi:zincin-like metallopeptidase domain-containing protein [Brevundimonas sp.]|uniref:ArdC family protein n=1 Tax=Brevundimonas sp. TaxID=1871086 RepID=UPI0028AA6353|nr:zincin-like metallopeptidase domain-containing protein [Brevundimonas sp.]
MKADIYQTVTDSIIGMLEAGVRPWAPGHNAKACGLPVIPTRANGEAYRGLNVALLWGAAEMKGYRHHTWMTFNQAKALGGCVRKGEKSSPVVYWGTFKVQADDADEGGEDGKARLFAKGYAVFNVEQIDGLPESYFEAVAPLPEVERIARAETWVRGTGAEVRHGGNRAYFSPAHDFVQMPPAGAFTDVQAYYGTLAHELTHWTGHEKRLARTFGKRFGDQAYAFEELVAEMGAAFAMARLGIAADPREDHASYLASWLKVLKQDKRAIFTAASKAQAACDHLFDLADKADFKPVERPSVPAGVICLPDLSGLSSAPVSAPVEDDDDTDPTPPVAPCPSPVSTGVAAGFLSRLTAFKGGRVRAPSRVAARKARSVDDIVERITTPEPVARPFHPRRDPSLCEFLSIRGICDDGGELAARDLDRWHREAPFRRKLVRPDGVSLETAARQAWEAGYFDHVPAPTMDSSDNMHPVSPEMLIAALDRELRDDYAHVWGEHDEAFFA